MKTQCEREDVAFIVVSATARFVSPMKSRLRASSSVLATCDESPRSVTSPCSSSVTAETRPSSPPPPPYAPALDCRESSRSKPDSL